MEEKNQIQIRSIEECLKMNLCIPTYQRPYKWSIQSIDEMLWDIDNAIKQSKAYPDFKYRIGTVILHKEGEKYNIVDGQQRMISLTLIRKYIDKEYDNALLHFNFEDKISQTHIHQNFQHISEWFSLRTEAIESFKQAYDNILEVVTICVGKESEAFQLFDSQNTRGRALDPHDLLKAYHLREMQHDRYEMEYAVNKWEEKDVANIREIFGVYLFPIWNWSRGTKTWYFTDKDIDTYKGIPANSLYTYARRASKAMPYFQITEPFIAGGDFFEMVDHYMRLLDNVKTELNSNSKFELLRPFCFPDRQASCGLLHVSNLFLAAILHYYDKFHNLDELAVKKLFMWAFMLRMDLEHLGADSVNKYAVGEWSSNYTNYIPVFSRISLARKHTEIGNLQIDIDNKHEETEEQKKLYKLLKSMSGYYE